MTKLNNTIQYKVQEKIHRIVPNTQRIFTHCLHLVRLKAVRIVKYSSLLITLCCMNVLAQEASGTLTKIDNSLTLRPFISDLPPSWAINVSPDNFLYVTHRNGILAKYALAHIAENSAKFTAGKLITSINLQLEDLHNEGQGGLSAIAFHPDYVNTPWIYLSYSYGNDNANGLKVIRVRLSEGADKQSALAITSTIDTPRHSKVTHLEVVFEQSHLRDTSAHYGARLGFMSDNTLLITTGDGFDYREQAQVVSSDMGKILRLTDVGKIPADNPFANSPSFSQQATYSLGHRNPQGLLVLSNNTIIANEHGPAGGDEINIIKAGANYGWPVITKGKDYIGSLITPFTKYKGMRQPDKNWTPSIAPSSLAFYTSDRLPQLTNRLLISSLKYRQLHTLALNAQSDGIETATNNEITDEVIFLPNSLYRMRDVTVTSDGRVFILTDGESASVFEVVMAP